MSTFIKPKILAFAGSTREDSFNKVIAKIAAHGAEEAGANVTYIDLRDYPMPLYDEDIQNNEGFPDTALKLKQLIQENQGLLIASPEYNYGYSAVLKNTIDWTSRASYKGEDKIAAYQNKVASLMCAAAGPFGGVRGLQQLRDVLMNMRVQVHPVFRTISYAPNEFSANRRLNNTGLEQEIKALGAQTVHMINSK